MHARHQVGGGLQTGSPTVNEALPSDDGRSKTKNFKAIKSWDDLSHIR